MTRIGDRMTFKDTKTWNANSFHHPDVVWRFDLLIGDLDCNNTNIGGHTNLDTRCGHPDKSGILAESVVENGAWDFFGPSVKFTQSFWESGNRRGPVDLNFAHQDCSVERYTDIEFDLYGQDERMAYVSVYNLPEQWQTTMPPQR
jgi:hypothetical protein